MGSHEVSRTDLLTACSILPKIFSWCFPNIQNRFYEANFLSHLEQPTIEHFFNINQRDPDEVLQFIIIQPWPGERPVLDHVVNFKGVSYGTETSPLGRTMGTSSRSWE